MNRPIETYPDARRCLILNLLAVQYKESADVDGLHREFANNGYVKLPGLFTTEAFRLLKADAQSLEQFAKERDFIMAGYGSPRVLKTLGGSTILRSSQSVWSLYFHCDLRCLIRRIVGAEVHACHHPDEIMVMNYLTKAGETHGWHLDDPAYALVLFLESIPGSYGGLLELIPRWRALCHQMGVGFETNVAPSAERCRAAGLVQVHHHVEGDAYLLRADQCLHRVTELSSGQLRRVVLNFAFEATAHPAYGATADKLYGD